MANTASSGIESVCSNFYCFMVEIYDRGGIGAICFLFLAFVFYRMVWKVWSGAMESKDREIERLIEERNFYQRTVLPERLTSDEMTDRDLREG